MSNSLIDKKWFDTKNIIMSALALAACGGGEG